MTEIISEQMFFSQEKRGDFKQISPIRLLSYVYSIATRVVSFRNCNGLRAKGIEKQEAITLSLKSGG